MSHRSFRLLLALAAAVLAVGVVVGGATATPKSPKSEGKAQFGELTGGARNGKAAFPTFSFSYTDPTDGITYPITMVGNDPRVEACLLPIGDGLTLARVR